MAPARAKNTVLLIEDTPSLQLIYRSVLSGAGHDVRVASSAAEGMTSFVQTGAQVVLLDLGLPDRDGLELMAEMMAIRPETRVIIITANGSINKAVEAMRAGAHEFLVKPFDEARFLNAVGNAIERSQTRNLAAKVPVQAGFIGASEVMGRIHAKINLSPIRWPRFSSPAKVAPAKSCARWPSMAIRRAPKARSSRSTVEPFRMICWNQRCLAM